MIQVLCGGGRRSGPSGDAIRIVALFRQSELLSDGAAREINSRMSTVFPIQYSYERSSQRQILSLASKGRSAHLLSGVSSISSSGRAGTLNFELCASWNQKEDREKTKKQTNKTLVTVTFHPAQKTRVVFSKSEQIESPL